MRVFDSPYITTALQYFLTDHLGSIVGVMDSTGTLTGQQRFLPFGGLRTDLGSITQTDHTYTGQRANSYMGVCDYRARQFDPALDSSFPQVSWAGDPPGHRLCCCYIFWNTMTGF